MMPKFGDGNPEKTKDQLEHTWKKIITTIIRMPIMGQ
jgi:hypothetical protein